jgi:putative protease
MAKPKAKKKASPKKKAKKKPAKKKPATRKKAPAKKKPAKKVANQKPLPPPKVEGTLLGRVEDFFAHVGVIALTLKSSLSVGQRIHVKGHTTDLTETVTSIQIEHESLQSAKKGDSVGIKIAGVARKRDWVFRED